MIGETLNNRYRVEERLGQGGMGSVYRALDIALNQKVAIKVLPTEISVSSENEKRFEREFLALTNLSHPNIVSVFDYGKTGGVIYFVMEYLNGHDMRWIYRSKPKKNEDFVTIVKIFEEVCVALVYMHQKGIIHRDLKPQNIFIQRDGTVKLMDFGLAKLIDSSVQLTQDGEVMGTATYMAPEQASGKVVGFSSDIYSLGAIMYHAICGVPLFTGANPVEIVRKHLYEKPAKPTYHNPFVPKKLVHIMMKALEKNPTKRYKKAEDMLKDLQNLRRILEDTKVLKNNFLTRMVHRVKSIFQ